MSFGTPLDRVLGALQLPEDARVGMRISKKTLVEQTSFAPGDRRALHDGIDELTWVANLAPSTVGLAPGGARGYGEVQVFALRLKSAAKRDRVIGLVHRAPAYPVLLVTADEARVVVSVAHVRASEGDVARTVTEDVHATDAFDPSAPDAAIGGFIASLALPAVRPPHLDALVDGWIDRVASLGACVIAGRWAPRITPENARLLRELHLRHLELTRELDRLHHAGERERQMNRLVDLNLQCQGLEAERRAVRERLEALTRADEPGIGGFSALKLGTKSGD